MAITDWPSDDRPREKLLRKGAEALSDAELVALFLRTGIQGKSAVELAREMMTSFGSLSALLAADVAALTAVRGMGTAKYAQLHAVRLRHEPGEQRIGRCADQRTDTADACRIGDAEQQRR